MSKKILTVIVTIFMVIIHAQEIGINTDAPIESLDVNGSLHVNEIILGGNDFQKGSAGKEGDVMVSQGEGKAPVWAELKLPSPENGDYFLKTSLVRTDTKGGILFTLAEEDWAHPYDENEIKDDKVWKEFEDFKIEIPAFDKPSRVVVNFQTIVQAEGRSVDDRTSFAIAIFLDKLNAQGKVIGSEMKAVRTGVCTGNDNPQVLFTIISTLDDLPANQKNTIRVAAVRRYSDTAFPNILVMGRDLPGATINESFGKTASMRVDIFEKIK